MTRPAAQKQHVPLTLRWVVAENGRLEQRFIVDRTAQVRAANADKPGLDLP